MINYRKSDIFSSEAQTLVNTVNCVGVMGKGIAKEFKIRNPEMFQAYKAICDEKLLVPGKLWLWRQQMPWVLNFPTKNHWRGPSKLSWIEAGLDKFAKTYREKGITSISFPKLGCGNGGLDWNEVRPIMEYFLEPVDIPVTIHEATNDPIIPEHIANPSLRHSPPASLEDFNDELLRYLKADSSRQKTILDAVDYEVHIGSSDNIFISIGDVTHLVSQDDIRGVWIAMQSGQISRKEAEWFNRDLGGAFIDVLARLPFTSASILTRGSDISMSVSIAEGRSVGVSVPEQEELI